EGVEAVRGGRLKLPAEAQIQSQSRRRLPVILNKRREELRNLGDRRIARGLSRRGVAEQKRRQPVTRVRRRRVRIRSLTESPRERELEVGSVAEGVVVVDSLLGPEFDRVLGADLGQRTAQRMRALVHDLVIV